MLRVWVYLALCAAGALTIALLLGTLASLITGAPAYGGERAGCILAADARPALAVSAQGLSDLSRTVWAEGRGEHFCGQVAIAMTAINRMRHDPATWGGTVSAVVRQPRQYSVWNTARQRKRLEQLGDSDPAYQTARRAALVALSGKVKDPTGGALYFTSARLPRPAWARGMTAQRIGGHIFYRRRDQ